LQVATIVIIATMEENANLKLRQNEMNFFLLSTLAGQMCASQKQGDRHLVFKTSLGVLAFELRGV
jgi:hypothetical protein